MNKKSKDLILNSYVILLGNISTKFVSFLLIPMYTAFLSVNEYGTVDLINSVIAFVIPLFNLQIEQGLFRYMVVNRDEKHKIKSFISTSLFFILIQTLIYFLIFILIKNKINLKYKEFLYLNVVIVVVYRMFLQITRGLGDNKTYSLSSFLTAVVTIIFNIIFIVKFNLGGKGMLISIFLGSIIGIIYIFYTKKIYIYLSFKFINRIYLKELLKYSVPLVPNELSWLIIRISDRAIVSMFLGVAANGIISIANKFSTIILLIFSSINTAWTESAIIYLNKKDNEEYVASVIEQMIYLFFSGGIIFLTFMPFVFPVMVNIKYENSYFLIPLYLYACLINIVIGLISVIYVAKKMTVKIAKTSFYAGIINIVIDLVAIKYIGIYAAPIASICGYLCMLIVRILDLNKIIRLRINKNKIRYIIFLIILSSYSYYLKIIKIHIFVAIVIPILLIILNFKELKFIFKLLKSLIKK